mmetsp:Transcript_3869/g.9165  ORF Transcript_3869/g.9165 Transcript_3869/m.9165 type:complete len:300 (-) Transcript_3869:143-1042(-)
MAGGGSARIGVLWSLVGQGAGNAFFCLNRRAPVPASETVPNFKFPRRSSLPLPPPSLLLSRSHWASTLPPALAAWTIPRKVPCALGSRSLLGVSNSSTRPSSMTRTRSLSMMVCRRCATVSTVAPPNSRRIIRWIKASVSLSMDAVASSSTSTRGCRSSARAMQMSCLWPTEKFSPPSDTTSLSLSGSASTAGLRVHLSSTAQIWASEWASKGSRLKRRVDENMTGSCGMMHSELRRRDSRTLEASTPSSKIIPFRSSEIRKSATVSEDLPEPVRPTMPTFSPAPTVKVKSLSTSGPSR